MPQVEDRHTKWSLTRMPFKVIGGVVAILATTAGLITNIDKIRGFFQPSLNGVWVLTNTIEQSTLSRYQGLAVTYQVFLTHNGHQISGTGEKIMENGKKIPAKAHSPIDIAGEVEHDTVIARFVLRPAPDGAARETRGQFEWHVVRRGLLGGHAIRLEGRFIATGASSQGRSVAVRPDS